MILAINNGERADRVRLVSAKRGYVFPVVLDVRGQAHRIFGVTLRPTTAVIGPDGRVLAIRAGAHSTEAWQEQLRRLGLPEAR